jgi:PTH1 family peptidyl-tRNA hydrolase
MESIVQNLQTEDIPRLRLGIAAAETDISSDDLVEFVLSTFVADEEETVQELIEKAADACESWLQEGNEATMDRFNG